MFILTDNGRIVNAEYLIRICRFRLVITALVYGDEQPVVLGRYDSEDECELAFDTFIETMKARKELYDLRGLT